MHPGGKRLAACARPCRSRSGSLTEWGGCSQPPFLTGLRHSGTNGWISAWGCSPSCTHVRTAPFPAGLVSIAELRAYVAEHPGAKGIARLRRVIGLTEPNAESPMETRLRMLPVLARPPRPEVQVSLHDHRGRFLGRPDLLYRRQKLAIEYDGGNHRDRLVDDNRRQNRLVGAGFRLLRFTAADVYGSPDLIAMQVRLGLANRDSAIRARMVESP